MRNILKKIWIVIKKIIVIIISIVEGVLCSLLANEVYKDNKIHWDLLSSASSFPWILLVLFILCILEFFEIKTSFSLENRVSEEKFKAYINKGVYDTLAVKIAEAIQNGDMTSLDTLKSMGDKIEISNK